tara:strand:+ start:434 stop:811 length:378 start_codon:yes stop_codon:yes gene_type:complete
MPRYERYPNESPAVARDRIARNKAMDRQREGQAAGQGRPAAPPVTGTPRTALNPPTREPGIPRPQRGRAAGLDKPWEPGRGNAPVTGAPRPPINPNAPRTRGSLMREGYNFTKNIGGEDLPDVGY